MKITMDRNVTSRLEESGRHEWIETNGLGGWAGSTVCGLNTRRYHGILVAATKPPVGRVVLLSRLDETIIEDGKRHELGCNAFPGAIAPRGYEHLVRFEKGYFPVFTYEAGGVRLRKTVAAVNGENTTLVMYRVLEAEQPFHLELRPFVAARDFHSLAHANDAIRREGEFSEGLFRVQPYDGAPTLHIKVPGSRFASEPAWWYNFQYREELERGLDFSEDLFTHGRFTVRLQAGDTLGVIVSTENPSGRDAAALFAAEDRRRRALLEPFSDHDSLVRSLVLAADQFIARRGTDRMTIIAGYPWFSDWGRDTMIALPGLCLTTGRCDVARDILASFASLADRGMLPNWFPDAGEQPEYNTVDAALWFFVASWRYWKKTGDTKFVGKTLYPALADIVRWHDRGTRYHIHANGDGLISAGEEGVQLTWMDAKVGNWVVTPRRGKPVEISALWYNALRIMSEFARALELDQEADIYSRRAADVRRSFLAAFCDPQDGGLYDVVDGDARDASIRPNQLYAVSLPFPLLEGDAARRVLAIVESDLLTPLGLRSLAPGHPDYKPVYIGGPVQRDGAYHQGTVWAFLLGAYISAAVQVHGREEARRRCATALDAVRRHIGEAGIGSISEIFDADEPHLPRGCFAQAWSVGEILRAVVEDLQLGRQAAAEAGEAVKA